MSFDQTNIVAVLVLAPFVAAAFAPLVHRALKSYAGWLLALVPAAMFAWLATLIPTIAEGGVVAARFDWVRAYGINLSFRIDGLSLLFAMTISGIGALIVLYSSAYLKGNRHQGRFLAFLLLFTGAMMGLVLADNLIALFAFWEMTSVSSFLLIGFDHTRQAARRAAVQALVVTGIGGLGLLLGAVVLNFMTGSWEISGLGAGLGASGLYPLALLLILLAAFTKSAQFPFHFWLPNAMEAPTPVSAFLHSATMVQGGVYLLARLSPSMGGTALWTSILVVFGAVTLLWGSVAALRQTDMKYMLAQTTIGSLGLLVLLIGLGSELAVTGAVLYFVAHAFYKAALFLAVGVIDHETGTRDITVLGGLSDKLPATFIAAALAGFSMFGLPASIGYLAKEDIFRDMVGGDGFDLLLILILLLGNAMLAAVGALVAIKPFLGADKPTPKVPHEHSVALLAGPLVLAVLGIAAGVLTGLFGPYLLAPAVGAITGHAGESHLALTVNPLAPEFILSLLTWGLAAIIFLRIDTIRTVLRRVQASVAWTLDIGFDQAMFGLIRFAALVTRFVQHGRLELYLLTLFVLLAVALLVPMLLLGGWPSLPAAPELALHEWGVMLLAVAGLAALVLVQNRLVAILSLGIQGVAVALIFLLFGAPDLAFTQLMVEVLSVVILALVMTRLKLDTRDQRPLEDLFRDGLVALLCGIGIVLLLWRVLDGDLDTRLADFFTRTSVALAHGHNIVNVILVDYRGLDTLGEISVVMAAGIAVLALLRRRPKPVAPPEPEAVPLRRVRARKVATPEVAP